MAVDGLVSDPLAHLSINVQSYDVKRVASVYADNQGNRWWTKAYFYGRERGESSIEISKAQACQFIHEEVGLDEWLSRFYPKQMKAYYEAISHTRRQLLY